MKQVIELNIGGHRLAVKSEEGEQYIRAVESYLNGKIADVKGTTKAVSSLDLTLLAALNITGELIKTKEIVERLGVKSEELSGLIERRLR
ncbi:MAG: cell division protein ZapA [Deltaproteobacteria bacterium]|nr:cell division protein ZapA [Deltaproteobacteria bacterium]